jgi:hypothetical protein
MYRLRGTPASSNPPDQLDLDRRHLHVTSDANGPRHGTSHSCALDKINLAGLCGREVEAYSELAPRSQWPRVPWKGGYPD